MAVWTRLTERNTSEMRAEWPGGRKEHLAKSRFALVVHDHDCPKFFAVPSSLPQHPSYSALFTFIARPVYLLNTDTMIFTNLGWLPPAKQPPVIPNWSNFLKCTTGALCFGRIVTETLAQPTKSNCRRRCMTVPTAPHQKQAEKGCHDNLATSRLIACEYGVCDFACTLRRSGTVVTSASLKSLEFLGFASEYLGSTTLKKRLASLSKVMPCMK